MGYSLSVLGLYPVLDGREILALSERMATGSLAGEPFYRAPFYPAILSTFLIAGVPFEDLPLAARCFNFLLHLLSTVLIWRLAKQVWQSETAALLAGSLFGFNPVVLHFVGDPLDVTLAITLMLAAIERSCDVTGRRPGFAGLLLGLAILTRPHLLVLAIAWIAVQWRVLDSSRRIALLCAFAMPLMVMAGVNMHLGGEPRILPWQGAFNLWAANRPGSNGRYFEHQLTVESRDAGANAARLEADAIYSKEHLASTASIDERNRYWRDRFLADALDEPLRLVKLFAQKLYFLCNDFEQYNNKTYIFHKRRAPLLALNPLNWSLLVTLSAAGLVLGWRLPHMRALAVSAGALAFGILLFYVSARFRLLLVPLLAVIAGGVTRLATDRSKFKAALGAAVLMLVVSQSPIDRADHEKTFVADQLLIARAASELGYYEYAISESKAALEMAPGNQTAHEIACVSAFNVWLVGFRNILPSTIPIEDCEAALPSNAAYNVLAHAHWQRNEYDEARSIWHALSAHENIEQQAAIGALLMTGEIDAAHVEIDLDRRTDPRLLIALAAHHNNRAAAILAELQGEDTVAAEIAHYKRLYIQSQP
ncbi:MAG: hypothetical protein AAF384_15070 [Pseudomonadota bacterium]